MLCSTLFVHAPLRMLGLADEPLKAVGGGPVCSFVPYLLFKAFDVTLKNCKFNKMTLLADRAE